MATRHFFLFFFLYDIVEIMFSYSCPPTYNTHRYFHVDVG